MKKNLVKIIVIIAFSIFCCTCLLYPNQRNLPTLADSGFDADYGGSDGGYSYDSDTGSSWDDDDNSWSNNYSNSWDDDDSSSRKNNYAKGSLTTMDKVMQACCLGAGIFCVVYAVRYKIKNSKRFKRKTIIKNSKINKDKTKVNKLLADGANLKTGEGRDAGLIQQAYSNYVRIQIAWMNRDLAPVKHLLTDEMYNMYQMQLDTLIEENQINVMSDFNFVRGEILSITTENGIETIEIILGVQCKDYIIDTDTNKIISGNIHSTLTYIYELTFLRDTNQEKVTHCPTCGAEVKKQMSATCPYCNNPLLLTSPEITLSNKKIKQQFKD